MYGRSDEEIKNHIAAIKDAAKKYFVKTEVEFTDNFENDFDPERYVDLKHPRIGYLAEAVKKIAYCDGVIFGCKKSMSKGCRVEHCIAEEYGLDVYYEDEDGGIYTEVW